MKKVLISMLIITSICLTVAGSLHLAAKHQKSQVYELVNQGNYDEALLLEAGSSLKFDLAKRFLFLMGQINAFIILFGLFVMITARHKLRRREKINTIELNPKFPLPPAKL